MFLLENILMTIF